MIEWQTDEFGNQKWVCPVAEGEWVLKIWNSFGQFDIDSPNDNWQVDLDEDSGTLDVFGEDNGPYYSAGDRVSIPLVVVREILACFDRYTKNKETSS